MARPSRSAPAPVTRTPSGCLPPRQVPADRARDRPDLRNKECRYEPRSRRGSLVTVPPELAAQVRRANDAMTAANLRFPASAPAPGQRTEDWEADVAACRARVDAFIAPGVPAAILDGVTTSEVGIGNCSGRVYRPPGPAPA